MRLTRFGNPILRERARRITVSEITDDTIQALIENIRYTNQQKKYGVGLAAPQVGVSVALSVIGIKPTPTRPDTEPFDAVIINPEYSGIGKRRALWEGCQSSGAGKNTLYAKVLRFSAIEATWFDETGKKNRGRLSGIQAHVFQHETDHLNGVLFVDKVRDTSTYMLADEYRKRIIKKDVT